MTTKDLARIRLSDQAATVWKAESSTDEWIEIDFGFPQTITEFKIKEEESSSVSRYVIECWDEKNTRWVGCFNGMNIGAEFVAPIVTSTRKARLFIVRTTSGPPSIVEFEAYNDRSGGIPITAGGLPK